MLTYTMEAGTCRVCLGVGGRHELDRKIARLLSFTCGLHVPPLAPADTLPTVLCGTCLRQIKVASLLKLKVNRTQRWLAEVYALISPSLSLSKPDFQPQPQPEPEPAKPEQLLQPACQGVNIDHLNYCKQSNSIQSPPRSPSPPPSPPTSSSSYPVSRSPLPDISKCFPLSPSPPLAPPSPPPLAPLTHVAPPPPMAPPCPPPPPPPSPPPLLSLSRVPAVPSAPFLLQRLTAPTLPKSNHSKRPLPDSLTDNSSPDDDISSDDDPDFTPRRRTSAKKKNKTKRMKNHTPSDGNEREPTDGLETRPDAASETNPVSATFPKAPSVAKKLHKPQPSAWNTAQKLNCMFCGKRVSNFASMRKHLEIYHNSSNPVAKTIVYTSSNGGNVCSSALRCMICMKAFPEVFTLLEHLHSPAHRYQSRLAPETTNACSCLRCGQYFDHRLLLTQHDCGDRVRARDKNPPVRQYIAASEYRKKLLACDKCCQLYVNKVLFMQHVLSCKHNIKVENVRIVDKVKVNNVLSEAFYINGRTTDKLYFLDKD